MHLTGRKLRTILKEQRNFSVASHQLVC